MRPYQIPVWKKAPFLRIIIPWIAGILFQYFFHFCKEYILFLSILFFSGFIGFDFLPIHLRYTYLFCQSVFLMATIFCVALWVTCNQDTRNRPTHFTHNYQRGDKLLIMVEEPLIEKDKTYKAECSIIGLVRGDSILKANGKTILYFSKKNAGRLPEYGTSVLISKTLQPIKASGNPGEFDYKRYLSFQNIYHNCFLSSGDYIVLKSGHVSRRKAFIFDLRTLTLSVLKKYLSPDEKIIGIAEALLIGYKEDLDKSVVKSYSNTGVVHIIAISGLHLGLIYMMLVWLLDRIPIIRKMLFFKAIVIILALWIFSLVTGASASVLRSAVMFTCIVAGKSFHKQSDIWNSLAVSAFILLCYNPFFIFDVGFQLSYLAIISIVSFQKSVHRFIYFKNIVLSKIWELMAVTLAAQMLTFPICLYYFHQFPNYFFISNLIAVPLSTIILFLEIFLLVLSPWSDGAAFTGKIIDWLIYIMNQIIQYIAYWPYSLLDNIYADGFTTLLLYVIVIFAGSWLIVKRKTYFYYVLTAILLFTTLHAVARIQLKKQKKIVVYNIPKLQGIDFIYQDKCFFYGDSALQSGGSLHDIKLKNSRTALQIKNEQLNVSGFSNSGLIKTFFGKKIMIVDSSVNFLPQNRKIPIDLLIISKNPNCSIAAITKVVQPAQIILDASNSLWKISKWKKECEAITLPCFSTAEQGAFICDIN